MANITLVKSPEEHKYIVIGEVHIAQILHHTIFQILFRDVLCASQIKHFEGINDIEVRLKSQLNLGRFDFTLRKDYLFYTFNKLF